jgi:hypothetical protein
MSEGDLIGRKPIGRRGYLQSAQKTMRNIQSPEVRVRNCELPPFVAHLPLDARLRLPDGMVLRLNLASMRTTPE